MSLTFVKQKVLSKLNERIKEYEELIPRLKQEQKSKDDSFWRSLKDCIIDLFFTFDDSKPNINEFTISGAEGELGNLYVLRKYVTDSKEDFVSLARDEYETIFLLSTDYYERYFQ